MKSVFIVTFVGTLVALAVLRPVANRVGIAV